LKTAWNTRTCSQMLLLVIAHTRIVYQIWGFHGGGYE
jgi:hypothetical protein